MSEFKVGDTVLIPVKIEDKASDAYWVRYGNEVFWVSEEFARDCEVDKAYNDGLDDAWKIGNRIVRLKENGGYSFNELGDIFGYNYPSEVFNNFSAKEAIEKEKEWEDKYKIHVRDQVKERDTGLIGVAIKKIYGGFTVLWVDGTVSSIAREKLIKTGKIIDVGKILEIVRDASC